MSASSRAWARSSSSSLMVDGKEAPQFPSRPYTDERGWWDGSIPRFCPLIIRVRVFNTEALPFRMIMTYLAPPFSVVRLSYMLQDLLGDSCPHGPAFSTGRAQVNAAVNAAHCY